MTNRDKLRTIGEALHGPRWKRATAAALGIDKRQIERWDVDEYDCPDSVIRDLICVARNRSKNITAAIAAALKG